MMIVEIREIESGRLVQTFEDVDDVDKGICNMMRLCMKGKYVLYPTGQNEYVEIHLDK